MDENCYEILSRLALPEINVIRLEEFEKADNELLAAKQNRSRIEYYFTCTPSLPIYVFKDCGEADVVTYLDADLYFFSDPHELYAEFDGNSIGIIEHRFAPKLRHWHQYGIYNVGWVMFRRGENAMACLQWWRQRCIEWCYDQVEADRFADQKYLNCWPKKFQQVAVLQHKGANLAPWNLENYEIRWRDDEISVDDQPLIFFHFHNLKHLQGRIYDLGLADYQHA
ncbi:MAG: glycosyl transferase, partial [bacterium]|nr:glycosyl transferase [bacterium]